MKNPITFTFHKSAGLLAALAGLALSQIPANSFAEEDEWEQAQCEPMRYHAIGSDAARPYSRKL